MTIKQLIAKRDKLQAQLSKVNSEIFNFKSDYLYIVSTFVYRINDIRVYNNAQATLDEANDYCGDNGFCYVYTNDPLFQHYNHDGGRSYYVESLNKDATKDDLKLISKEYKD